MMYSSPSDRTLKFPRGSPWSRTYLLLPVLVLSSAVILLPSVWAIVLSFYRYRLASPKAFLGLGNYIDILSRTHGFWNAAFRTVAFALVTVALELILGLAISLLLARGFPLQRLWLSLIIAPFAVSPVVSIIMWKYMFNMDYGVVNYLLSLLHLEAPNWFTSPYASFAAIVIIDVWASTPFAIIIIYPSIISIADELLEAARLDGAGGLRTLRFVTLPLIRPAINTTLIFRTIFALRLFEPIWLFNQGGPVEATTVVSIYIYNQGFVYWNFGIGSCISVILLVITMVVSFPQMNAMRRDMLNA